MKKRPILFDLGVVLLHLDYGPALARARPLCDPGRGDAGLGFLSLLERTHHVADYELGRMTAWAFFGHFAAATGFRGSFDDFADLWRGIFRENRPMLDLARELARDHDLYLLTNASDLHVPWVFERFPDLRIFKGYAASCYLGCLKPDAAFYRRSLEKFGLAAADGLFIDDRPENVAGAEACGIRSILYTGPEAAIRAIRASLDRPVHSK